MNNRSPFGWKARRRQLHRRIRRRAPKHPRGPEIQVKTHIARIFRTWHQHLRTKLVDRALRVDAASSPDAKGLLKQSGLKSTLNRAAKQSAKDIAWQTAYAVNERAPIAAPPHARALAEHDDVKTDMDEYVSRIFNGVEDLLDESVTRANDIYDEWDELDPDRSPRAEDPDALDDMLEAGLLGLAGRAAQLASNAFASLIGALVQSTQTNAGVASYMWNTQLDSRVRPEHAELDGKIADWDDPPLKADKSDNEEDDHPGDDYNCRCVAAPVFPDEMIGADDT